MMQPHEMMADTLHNQFKGAIAGAILGYLTGLHYQAHPTSLASAALDLSWLVPASTNRKSNPDSFPILQALSLVGSPKTISVTIPPQQGSLFSMLRGLDSLIQDHHGQIQCQRSDAHRGVTTPLQASFILLPFLVFFCDSTTIQHNVIQHALTDWQCPIGWTEDIMLVGRMVSDTIGARAIASHHRPGRSDTIDDSINNLEPRLISPAIHLSCSACRYFHSYELNLRILMHQASRLGIPVQADQTSRGHTLALMAGVTGALLGGRAGFSGLPLLWQYVVDQLGGGDGMNWGGGDRAQEDRPSNGQYNGDGNRQMLDWSTQLVTLWGGVY